MSNCPTKTTASGSSKKKSKNEAFVWTDDEVDLLLSVVLEYKIAKTSENFDWETCQSKYADILDLFISQYPSAENAIQLDKEFPHQENELTKAILTSKMKAFAQSFALPSTVEEKVAMEELSFSSLINARKYGVARQLQPRYKMALKRVK